MNGGIQISDQANRDQKHNRAAYCNDNDRQVLGLSTILWGRQSIWNFVSISD